MRSPSLVLVAVVLSGLPGRPALPQSGYPTIPRALSDSEEVALARSAAPDEISQRAAVYGIRNGKPTRLVEGSNGCACMVARDLHAGSLYPICFDNEGARTRMWRELEELRLRMAGVTEDSVKAHVADAFRVGTLKTPGAFSVAYMMSPKQVLFSSPYKDGRRVGPWSPHLMIMAPGLSGAALGLRDGSAVTQFSVDVAENHTNELVVKLPSWSDGTPARP